MGSSWADRVVRESGDLRWPPRGHRSLADRRASRRAVSASLEVAWAGGVSGVIMAFVGFVPDAPVQPEGAVTGTRITYILVPVVGALLAIWVMRDYDVTEQRAKENRAELERRRGKTLLA